MLNGSVTIDPDILDGSPVSAGTIVPVENLFDFIAGGYDLNGFLHAFPRLGRRQAQRVLQVSSASLMHELGTKAA